MVNSVELPNLSSDIRKLVDKSGSLPPVETWNPDYQGEIDISIARDGSWYYQGNKMERESMVKLFSTILRLDNDGYCLVTPADRLKIVVEDVPFIIRLMDVEGIGKTQSLHFSNNVGDCFTLSEEHPMTISYNQRNEPAPYVVVRRNLQARLNRTVYYQLADLVVESEQEEGKYGVWSKGKFFVI